MKPANHRAATEADRTPLDWAREHGEADRVLHDLDALLARRRRARLRTGAMCAVALVVLVAALLPAWRARRATIAPAVAAEVTVLRPETRLLPDGSVIELRPGAEVSVDFTGTLRRVFLQQGEAHFRVVRDRERPFIVTAGGIEVRAVGTAFAVGLAEATVEVVVTEGRVAVEKTETAPAEPLVAQAPTFDAGKRVVVDRAANLAAPQVEVLSADELALRLAWRVPKLEFAATPLDQALAMFNAHGSVRFALADPALGRLQLSGVLRADNTSSLLRVLESEFGLVAEPRGEELVLRRR